MTGAPWESDPVVGQAPSTPSAPNAAPASDQAPWAKDPTVNAPAKVESAGYTTQAGFNDELPAHAHDMPPEIQHQIVNILSTHPVESAAADARQFAASKGYNPAPAVNPKFADSFDEVAAYRKTHGVVSDSVINKLPDPTQSGQPQGAGPAFVRGLLPVNTLDSAIHTAKDVVTGDTHGSATDDFRRWEDTNYGILQSDEANHPVARLTGQLIGGLAIPSGAEGEALNAGKSVLKAGGTMREARAAAAAAAAKRIGKEGAAVGSGYGFDASAPGQGAVGAVEGAAAGGGGGYAIAKAAPVVAPYVSTAASKIGDLIGSAAPADDVVNAAKSAGDLGVDLPAFAVQGSAAEAKAANLTRKGGFGATALGNSAQTAIDQSQAARDHIAGTLGVPQALDASLGGDIKSAAIDARTQDRSRIGRMFSSGDEQMAGVPVPLKQTTRALNDLVDQDGKAIVSSPVTPLIEKILERVKAVGGSMSAADLRSSTQNLKALMRANNIDATTSDHVMGVVRDAMNADMEAAAKGSGNEAALQTYKDAREQWGASKLLDKTVLKPILGAAFQNTGDQVINSIKSAVINNGTRVAQLFSTLPDDVANIARASLIGRMGIPTNGKIEDFSLQELLKNYNKLGGSRRLIFSPETNQALDKLAAVAERGKALETVAQNGAKAPPFGVKKLMTSGPAVVGEVATMFTHDVKDLAAGAAISALGALGQWRSAKLLANPDFARRLASMPVNPKAAEAFWKRPWVAALASRNPTIGAEVGQFQKAVNDNFVMHAAASTNAKGPGQNQQANGTKPQ